MMRKLLLGIAAAAALGAATLSAATPVSAQSWSLTFGSGGGFYDDYAPRQYYRPVRPDGWHGGGWRGGWHDGWRRRPAYDGYGFHAGPRCHVRKVRYWDGWGWVVDRRRVCS